MVFQSSPEYSALSAILSPTSNVELSAGEVIAKVISGFSTTVNELDVDRLSSEAVGVKVTV